MEVMGFSMMRVCAFSSVLWIAGAMMTADVKNVDKSKDHLTYEIETVQGGSIDLPCNVTPSLPNDKMLIVIWFKENSENDSVPIYTFDSRETHAQKGKHWADDHIFGGRAHFWHEGDVAKLTLKNVKEGDSGRYSCRVDFKQSPTRSVFVNLLIILPPEKLSILDERGLHIPNYILGPYNEGTSINVTCVATGGRPPPNVTWWQGNILQDDSYELLPGKQVRNVLYIAKLERKHLHSILTCQASNNDLLNPITSSITLDVNLKPMMVQLSGQNRPLSANHTYELTCEVIGARPVPTITWWKGSVQMKNSRETTNADQNITTSFLTFTPTVEDSGKYLSCRGQQPLIPQSGIEDGWKLNIYHKPIVSLELGNTLNGSVIKEGVDVYFECNIKSNPWVYRVTWKHNGKVLYNNAQANILVSNQSLVLQSITRAKEGNFVCIGHNSEGDGESNVAYLDVKYEPVCRPGQSKVYGVAKNEMVRILCELEANPSDIKFHWKFTSSIGTIDIPSNHFHSENGRSTLGYKPVAESDYGTAMCWGENSIGVQKEPCIFYINPAGKPDPLTNCTIANQTAESLHVECADGFDGGLHQDFVMEVYDSDTGKLVSNATSSTPIFTIGGLASGMSFNIKMYSVNKKGRSRPAYLQAFTVTSIERRIATKLFVLKMTPLFFILVAITIALITTVLIIIMVRNRNEHHQLEGGLSDPRYSVKEQFNKGSSLHIKDICSSVDSLADSNPDVIPQSNSENGQDDSDSFNRIGGVLGMDRYKCNINRLDGCNLYKENSPAMTQTLRRPSIKSDNLKHQQMPPLTVIFSQEATIYTMLNSSKDAPECPVGTVNPILLQTRPKNGMRSPPYVSKDFCRKQSLPDQTHQISTGTYSFRHQ